VSAALDRVDPFEMLGGQVRLVFGAIDHRIMPILWEQWPLTSGMPMEKAVGPALQSLMAAMWRFWLCVAAGPAYAARPLE